MQVGIIDADLLGRRNHRFPNLVCMKIAAYHKRKGDTVTLITDCSQLEDYGRIYEAKVFTDTPDPVPDSQKHVQIFRGGRATISIELPRYLTRSSTKSQITPYMMAL